MQVMAVTPHYEFNVIKQQTVTASAVVLTALVPVTDAIVGRPQNIFVQALAGNTGKIMIGFSNVLLNGSSGGWELAPGGNMNLPSTKISELFCIGPGTSEKLQITYSSGII